MRDFRKLEIWKRSHQFALKVYTATQRFPKEEAFGLTSQIRRASVSIPANIAEGCGRDTETELKRFLHIAHGSTGELDSLIELARDLNFVDGEHYNGLVEELTQIKRMIGAFARRLKAEG